MSKISNALTMLKILETGRIYKISELALLLNCSERSVRTYKEDLEKSGIYIESIPGRYGGYFYAHSSEQNYFNFNKLDLNRLENLYLYLKKNTDIELTSLETIIDKLRYVLIIDYNSQNSKISNLEDIYNYMSKTICEGSQLTFVYKGKNIVFIPHNIYINKNNIYITGINCATGQIRTYNVNDIKIKKY